MRLQMGVPVATIRATCVAAVMGMEASHQDSMHVLLTTYHPCT